MIIKFKSFFVSLFFLLYVQATVFIQAKDSTSITTQSVVTQNVDVNLCLNNLKGSIYKETFDNGLTLLFYRKEHTPEVMLKVLYDVGSKDEESSEYGFAHLVEHMIFKGTKKLSEQDIFEISRKFGVESNAATSYDQTVYYFYADNKNWKVFLNILADCMENAQITDEHISSELKAVFDELKLRDADGAANIFAELLPSNHPYHHPVIGYKENLLNLNPEKVRAFYKKYYRPDRATIMVVGDLDKDDVVREVKAAFGSIPCPEKIVESKKGKAEFTYINKDLFQKNIVVYKSIPNTQVCYVWTTPGNQDTKKSLSSMIIGKYLRDRLSDILHDEKMLVAGVGAGSVDLLKAGIFLVGLMPLEQKYFFSKKDIDEVSEICKKTIVNEIEHIIVAGIPQDEFTRIRRLVMVDLLHTFEDCGAIANALGNSYMINKNKFELFDEIEVLDSVTNEDVKSFANHYLRSTLMNLFTIKPLNSTEKDEWLKLQKTVDEYDNSLLELKTRREQAEKSVESHDLPTPELLDVVFENPDAEFDLRNGLHVVIKQRKDTPFIVSQLFFKNSDVMYRYFDEKGKSRIPDWAKLLLPEGSVGYSKQDHRKFFESLGASSGGVSCSCLASDFDVVAQRCVHILTKPTYPQKSFDRMLQDSLNVMEEMADDASHLAAYNLTQHLEQDDFLSKKTLQEEVAELKKYKRAELIEFHKKYMVPHNMVLAVVGDFNEKTIKQQLEKTFGQWKASPQACDLEKIAIKFPDLKNPAAKEQKIWLPKERIALNAGRITVKSDEDDYFKLALLEQYLNKRLFELREKQGLFYHCSGSLTGGSDKQQGVAQISAELSLANTDMVIKLIKSVLNDIAQNGIPQEDFEFARSALVNELAKSTRTNGAIAYLLGDTKASGFDWNRREKRFKKIMQVSCEDVNTTAKKYLNADEWSFVTVGRVEEDNK